MRRLGPQHPDDRSAQRARIACRELFTHFGGHEFACGFSLEARNLDALRARLHERFETFDETLFRREAHIDATLTLAEIDAEFLAAHEMLQPFGAGNTQPLFLVRDVTVTGTRTFAEDCCELSLQDATGRATGVLWPSVKELARRQRAGGSAGEGRAGSGTGARLEIVDAQAAKASSLRAAAKATRHRSEPVAAYRSALRRSYRICSAGFTYPRWQVVQFTAASCGVDLRQLAEVLVDHRRTIRIISRAARFGRFSSASQRSSTWQWSQLTPRDWR